MSRPRPLRAMPAALVARANWGIAHLEDWDLARLFNNMARIYTRWGHATRSCRGCDREPVYDVTPGCSTYCDFCRMEAAA